jgi:hypothetical protein
VPAGITLIDRNDELCVLYERQALQESVLARGMQEMAARGDEARMLRLHCAELERSIHVAQGVAPQVRRHPAVALHLAAALLGRPAVSSLDMLPLRGSAPLMPLAAEQLAPACRSAPRTRG